MKKGKQKITSEKKKNILQKYNERSTKGNIQNTLLKGAVDTVAGSVVGTGIGAFAGNKAALAGIALIFAGHYMGDESGVLRLTGASAMAYGIGKAQVYKNDPEMKSAVNRLGGLKQDLLGTFFRKFKEEEKDVPKKKGFSLTDNEMDIEPIRFTTTPETSITDETTDLDGYFNFNDEEDDQIANEREDEVDDELDQLYGDDFRGIDLTLI